MKILQVCNKPPFPANDGGSLAMYNLAHALQLAGHHVEVLTMVTGKHKLSDDLLAAFRKIMPVHTVYVDTRISIRAMIVNSLFSRQPYNAVRFISHNFRSHLAKLVAENHYDIIQLEGLYLLPYIETIRNNCHSLIAYRAHNIEYEIWERISKQEKNLFKKIYFRMLARRIRRFENSFINTWDLLIPITWRDEKIFSEMGNIRPSTVCQAGFDTFKVPVKKNGMPSVYFLGSLDWIPNQEGLLWFIEKIFPLLRKSFPDLTFHIAGRNAPAGFIKKISGEGIVFHGEIDSASDFMMNHDILVAPCFSGSGMRIKIVEAMSHGKTVVTTSIGAEGIPVKNNVNILIADDEADFYTAVEKLMKYDQLCYEIGHEAMKFVQLNYSSVNIAATLANFYNHHLK